MINHDDFKKVIDVKSLEWNKDPKMCKYLRPETLFGNKFEGYLNEGGVKNEKHGRNYEINRAEVPTIEEGDDPIF